MDDTQPTGAGTAVSEPVTLREKLAAGRFVVNVEVDPPHGLSPRRALEGAALLKQAGVDALNIGDSPAAKVRMSSFAMSVVLQQELGLEVVMHYTTRDRNAMAIHSDMAGAHALGIRNILCLRGDPPALGGYKDVIGVWDVSAVGLMRILKLLNEGQDWTGEALAQKGDFFIGAAANLNADPLEPEVRLMRRKVEAGAHFFVTQNVFEEKRLERFLDKAKQFGLPVLVGVILLNNDRHADFLHTQVPGMFIPDDVRERMRRAGENGPREGQAIAREIMQVCREKAAGVYLVPAFGRYDLASEIVAEFKS